MQGREAREVGREARSYRTASHRVIDRDNGDGSVRCRRNSGRERERGVAELRNSRRIRSTRGGCGCITTLGRDDERVLPGTSH